MKSWHQVLLGYIEEEREIKARIEAVAALKNRLRSAHRRRIKIEENAKVVASVWGEECTGTGIQFLLLWIGHSILHTQVLWTVFRRRDILAVGGLKARPGKKAAF